jgi:hypothetical protein
MFVSHVIRRVLIPVGICAVAGWYIFDTAHEYTKTDVERMVEGADDPLLKQTTFRFGTQVLQNPGEYINLPDDVRGKVDAQITAIARSGQKVLCCDYDSDELPRMCTGYKIWKDTMPTPLEAFVDVHPYSTLAYLGERGHETCPATRQGIWDAVGIVPGHGWSPRHHGKSGYPTGLREQVLESRMPEKPSVIYY